MTGRPKVVHVVSHLDLGGAENVAISLAEALRDRFDFEFFATLGVRDTPVGRQMHDHLAGMGMAVVSGTSLEMNRGGLIPAGWKLARYIRRQRPDIVHLHTERPEAAWAIASAASPFVRSVPTLRTIHNTTLWPSWKAVGHWAERKLGTRPAVGVSTAALAGLDALRTSAGLQPLPDGSRHLVLNGIASPPQRTPGRGQPNEAVKALFAGRLEHQKGADLIPAIWDRVRQAGSANASLTVVGDGSLAPDIDSYAAAIGASIRRLPPLYGIASRLKDFDVLLMPSRFEGLPLLAVEALMAGLPVVAFDSPGIREVFPPGYPLLAPTGDVDAIARLLAEQIAAPALPDRDRAIASVRDRFGLSGMVEDYAQIYGRMAASV